MIYPELTLNLDVLLSGHGNFQKGSTCTSPKIAPAILGEAGGGKFISTGKCRRARRDIALLGKMFFPKRTLKKQRAFLPSVFLSYHTLASSVFSGSPEGLSSLRSVIS